MKQTVLTILALILIVIVVIGGIFFIKNSLPARDSDTDDTESENVIDDGDEDNDDEDDMDMSALDKIIEEESDIDNDVSFDEEISGADLVFRKASEEDFIGTWVATSGQAEFMYGNVKIKVLPLHRWTANIAEEDFEGKWEFEDDSCYLKSEYVNLKLSFTRDGKLVMQEDRDGSGEYINTVLTRKK